MVEEIKEQIKAYCGLRFTEEELEYLHKIKWVKGSYVDFLRLLAAFDMKIMRLRRTPECWTDDRNIRNMAEHFLV